ncbi:hypothetical protein [Streptomyces sp. NPDC050546]|uniref:hypothetical protein n=1 Tax=Streptomyces sp. NPDC050546 TaxID=3365628 RepID=UPI0037A0822A
MSAILFFGIAISHRKTTPQWPRGPVARRSASTMFTASPPRAVSLYFTLMLAAGAPELGKRSDRAA